MPVRPKLVRQALSLEPGAQFQVEVVNKKIVLKPVSRILAVDQLYGKKEEPAASRVHKLLQEAEVQQSKLFLSIINLGGNLLWSR